jgi:hypothetical protein
MRAGELTETALAEKTGFRQAHISNFLLRKRGLSVRATDDVLLAEELSVLDLVKQEELDERFPLPPALEGDYANVLLVASKDAMLPQVLARNVLDVVKIKQSLLRRMRADVGANREHWARFLLIHPSREDCEAMRPRLVPRCMVLLDRHYNALAPYRRGDHPMCAVRCGDELMIRYVSLEGRTLALQGQTHKSRLHFVPVPGGAEARDLIVGRVAYVWMET